MDVLGDADVLVNMDELMDVDELVNVDVLDAGVLDVEDVDVGVGVILWTWMCWWT